jgi:hypothetical protein
MKKSGLQALKQTIRKTAPVVKVEPVSIPIESTIIQEFPRSLGDLATKKWKLLYRGTRDGFGPRQFHRACDHKGNTVVLIETSKKWVLGGYSPCVWESTMDFAEDTNGESFLFSLKRPGGTEAMMFPIKKELKRFAIYACMSFGPTFGRGHDLLVGGRHPKEGYLGGFGDSYTDTSGKGGEIFTGGDRFEIAEMEVWQRVE